MNAREFLRFFSLNCGLKIARGMQYRFDFAVGMLVSLTLSFMGPIFSLLIFTKINGYPGWNLQQILVLQGVTLIWLGIKDLLFAELRGYIEGLVKGGDFDRLLLKPYPALGIIFASGFHYYGLGTLLSGMVVTSVSLQKMGLTIQWWQAGAFLLFLVEGIVLYSTVLIGYCLITVLACNMGRLGEILDKLMAFTLYPVEIFPAVTRLIFVAFFPVAVWVYFPTQVLLNRLTVNAYLSIVFCAGLFWGSLKLWDLGIKNYQSAGG